VETRAAVAFKAGEPLRTETVRLDGPKNGEVLVEIKATGICHTDEFILSGADPEGLFPAILGHEGAGIVVDVGPGVTSLPRATMSSRSTLPNAGDANRGDPSMSARGLLRLRPGALWEKSRFSAGFTMKAISWFPLREFAHGGKGEPPRLKGRALGGSHESRSG
jgi:NADPH:quinone reductase-like Zn-dependent oxidoreductase